ncbi:hypothetical protein HaLaN_14761 [Haematococcus lacustris]|uniref:Uncharacterized protein n=1 Tax=Haematococcus lacustris TaxID=44745 RepID=A0A699ZG16_HAELA|nr:hypothetical protein HaLaN_14761 [Haematococcus lacustris]
MPMSKALDSIELPPLLYIQHQQHLTQCYCWGTRLKRGWHSPCVATAIASASQAAGATSEVEHRVAFPHNGRLVHTIGWAPPSQGWGRTHHDSRMHVLRLRSHCPPAPLHSIKQCIEDPVLYLTYIMRKTSHMGMLSRRVMVAGLIVSAVVFTAPCRKCVPLLQQVVLQFKLHEEW